MLTLSQAQAKQFFDGLYDGPPGEQSIDRGAFYEIATRVIARSGEQTTVGAAALQALILNYLQQKRGEGRASVDAVSIAHISRPGVSELLRAYPHATLDELIRLAKANGYEVEVVGSEKR